MRWLKMILTLGIPQLIDVIAKNRRLRREQEARIKKAAEKKQ